MVCKSELVRQSNVRIASLEAYEQGLAPAWWITDHRLLPEQLAGQVLMTIQRITDFSYCTSRLDTPISSRLSQSVLDLLSMHRHTGVFLCIGHVLICCPIWMRSREGLLKQKHRLSEHCDFGYGHHNYTTCWFGWSFRVMAHFTRFQSQR